MQGVRANQLVGYGLVVGLAGTGDQTSQAPFTIQSIKNMLIRYGVTIPANTNPQLKNVAAVTVHADLPPFSKTGQTIDVTVSSIGNAQSLRGGSLIMTPLIGADGEVYAIAQGSLVVGGFGVSGKDGSQHRGQRAFARAAFRMARRSSAKCPTASPPSRTSCSTCIRRTSPRRRASPKASTSCWARAPRSRSTACR